MPHKHTRREKDPSTYDLPPSETAKPLPVTSISRKNAPPQNKGGDAAAAKKNLKRKRGNTKADDAPRAFKKLMAFAQGKKPRSGLDDGIVPGKKKKAKKQKDEKDAAASEEAAAEGETTKEQKVEIPTIRPGERLSEFAARVDAALPVMGMVNKTTRNGKDPLGLKVRRTHKEKKMHRLYEEWREEDKRIRERAEEEREEAEERATEQDEALGVAWRIEFEDPVAGSGGGKRKKKGRGKGGREEDPWAEVKRRRGEVKAGLNDVVQAPPELKAPENKLVGRTTAQTLDVPKAAGSLRQREELQGIRDDVVSSYRKLMSGKRSTQSA